MMFGNRYIFYVVFLMMIAGSACGQTAQEIFLRANKCYDEKDFAQAYDLYQSLEHKDVVVLYNIGNCNYKLGNFVGALASWHQAMRNANPALLSLIHHNISVVQKQLGAENQMHFVDHIEKKVMNISLLWLQLLFLFFWFALFFFIKKYKRDTKYKIFFSVLLLFCVISSGFILMVKYHSLTRRKGIVMESNVSIFAGPDDQYHVLASLPQASCVNVTSQREKWCKIKHNDVAGWVMKDTLTVV